MGADAVDRSQIAGHYDQLFLLMIGAMQNRSAGVGHEGGSPKLKASLEPHSICRAHIATVSNCMSPHRGFPRVVLHRSVLLSFLKMPADGRGKQDDLCSTKGHQSSRLRVPLIPADANTQASVTRLGHGKPEVAWCKIEFLVISGVVRNVHLAVDTNQLSIGVKRERGIVVQAMRPTLKQGTGHYHRVLLGGLFKQLTGGPIQRLRQIESHVILGLTRVLSIEDLLKAYNMGPHLGRFGNTFDGFIDVLLLVRGTGHLNQG